MIFGKRLSEYLAFERALMALVAVVGLLRLSLSLVGLPNAAVTFLSTNVVLWAGALYLGAAVHTRGFGSYRQVLPLVFFPLAVGQSVAILGILLSIAGFPNIYTAPEYSGPIPAPNHWIHLLAHLTIGMVVPPFLLWGAASLVMRVTKGVTRRRTAVA